LSWHPLSNAGEKSDISLGEVQAEKKAVYLSKCLGGIQAYSFFSINIMATEKEDGCVAASQILSRAHDQQLDQVLVNPP
jgi:hypothetical protein